MGRHFSRFFLVGLFTLLFIASARVTIATNPDLFIAYPPNNHRTTSDRIFFIGSAPIPGEVTINDRKINRNKFGYFAPSLPLKIGENNFTIAYRNKTLNLKINRIDTTPAIPSGGGFAAGTLKPDRSLTRLAGESLCFEAIAAPNSTVAVDLNNINIPLSAQDNFNKIPSNAEVLTGNNRTSEINNISYYRGCRHINRIGNLGKPNFKVTTNNQNFSQQTPAEINITDRNNLPVIEVSADRGVARIGPSSDYSRLTPLPRGTRATVTGKEGDWLRLDYGGWINEKETKLIPGAVLDKAIIRGVSSKIADRRIDIIFPLSYPVPIALRQENDRFILTLYNTIAQTDTVFLARNPVIERIDWRHTAPDKIEYTFNLKNRQLWGYDAVYDGSNLIIGFRYPPDRTKNLQGVTILLDPGHGGKESGAVGPTGYTEKEANLALSMLIKEELTKLGARVILTRDSDVDVSLNDRVNRINELKPTLALSIHYNALPDNGDALNTDGVGMFWFHPQAENLASFLHDYLVSRLKRPSYGVFWNNLALTRPHTAPSLLLELGFMSNPDEFAWITDPEERKKLARTIAGGVLEWFDRNKFGTSPG